MADPNEPEDPIAPLLARCYEELHAGRQPDLEALCGGDASLRQRLEALLALEHGLVGAVRQQSDSVTLAALAGSTQLEPGDRLGEFSIVAPLGAGGMGDVYVAIQEPLGRRVALKVISCRTSLDRVAALRFRREAEIMAALDHPNIVPVYASGEVDGVHFLAMRLLDGQNLEQAGRQPPRVAAALAATIARALDAAHRVGVVHRDVKPENIVLEQGVPYVLDFGLARSDVSATLTQDHAMPGTLPYMAPEQLQGRGSLDARVDVYGLGATLYHILSGRPPFASEPRTQAIQSVLQADPPRLRGVDRDLEVIVLRALHKNPLRRFRSAAEMADDLQRYLDGEPIRSRPISRTERIWRVVRRNRTVSVVTLLAFALVISLVAVQWSHVVQRRERWRKALDQVAADTAAGDVDAGRRGIQAITDEFGVDSRLRELQSDLATESLLQELTGELQGTPTYIDKVRLEQLSDTIAADRSRLAASDRAVALVAVARCLARSDTGTLPVPAALPTAAYPRTRQVLEALGRRQLPVAEAPLPAESNSAKDDRLLAALALRVSGAPEALVERELHAVGSNGGDGVLFALAVSAERQLRRANAYDLYARACANPIYAAVAYAGCARCALGLRRVEIGKRDLASAVTAVARAPHSAVYVHLTELEVLLELGDDERFWRRWRELAPVLDKRWNYWLQAVYAHTGGQADAAQWAKARECLQRALACAGDRRPPTLVLSSLELDYLTHNLDSISPLEPTAATAAIRKALSDLADRAYAFAKSGPAHPTPDSEWADAMLVAADAARSAGRLEFAWRCVEECSRDYASPRAMAKFAYWVGFGAACRLLGEPDLDAAVVRSIPANLGKGLLWAQQALAVEVGVLHAFERHSARVGLCFCALELNEPLIALPSALALLRQPALDPTVQELAQWAVDGGGLRLAHAFPAGQANSEQKPILLDACLAMRRALQSGQWDGKLVTAALLRWRECPELANVWRDDATAWADLRAEVDQLAELARAQPDGK